MAKGTSRVGKNDLVGTVAGTTELTKENTKKVQRRSGWDFLRPEADGTAPVDQIRDLQRQEDEGTSGA
jgi:hypothetical protein